MWFRRRQKKDGAAEADRAIENAQENLSRIEERGQEISEISDTIRAIREHNHFAEALGQVIIRRRGTTT